MSAIADFYMECAERGVFPLEADKPRPAGMRLRTIYTLLRTGRRMRVTGISTSDAIEWWNKWRNGDRAVPAPPGMREWLEDFAGCERCGCGTVARPFYFADTLDGERVCLDCY